MSEPAYAYSTEWRDWLHTLPEHLQDGVRNYIEHGTVPGAFLLSCLQDSLIAVLHADRESCENLRVIVTYLVNYMPAQAWGSPEKVKRWSAMGGLNG